MCNRNSGGRGYYRGNGHNVSVKNPMPDESFYIASNSSKEYFANVFCPPSDALRAACYDVGIKLIHRPPRDPAPGALVERFFGARQTQFEAEIRSGDITTPLTKAQTAAYIDFHLKSSGNQDRH